MSDTSIIAVASGVGGTVLFGLIGVVWNMVRNETKAHADALEKKASAEQLRDAKSDLHARLEEMKSDHHSMLQEVKDRQEREIDRLTSEMDKLSNNVAEMRRENNQANTTILARLHDMALNIGNGK